MRLNIRPRSILLVAPVALASVSWLPNEVIALDFSQARVTQVVQDVKVVPSGAAARPAAVNETVHKGSAVQTGTQSRSELTFQDQSITRLGEKTIFSVGGDARSIELGSGQFLLYVPKKAGGAKVKMGSVTAAITGTTVLGNVNPNGIVEFTVLEGTANVRLDSVGQCLRIHAGQKVTYDPVTGKLGDPVDVDIQKQLSSPLVADFGQLPSATLINQEVQLRGKANDDLARAVSASGATIGTATPEQFLAAFDSLVVRGNPREVCALVGRAARARPDLASRIAVAALTASRPVRPYSRDFRQVAGRNFPVIGWSVFFKLQSQQIRRRLARFVTQRYRRHPCCAIALRPQQTRHARSRTRSPRRPQPVRLTRRTLFLLRFRPNSRRPQAIVRSGRQKTDQRCKVAAVLQRVGKSRWRPTDICAFGGTHRLQEKLIRR